MFDRYKRLVDFIKKRGVDRYPPANLPPEREVNARSSTFENPQTPNRRKLYHESRKATVAGHDGEFLRCAYDRNSLLLMFTENGFIGKPSSRGNTTTPV
jgi:hypothetical protein